ncbi:MAG: hypothetical protein K2X47_01135, partial [Bdellovibrionales bacterium]|nr:hypothetical protein [Bdellovibrionales bacterium]
KMGISKKGLRIDELVPEQAEDVFSSAQSFQGFQIPGTRLGMNDKGAQFSLETRPDRVHCRQVQLRQGLSGGKKDLLQCVVVTPLDFQILIDDRPDTNLSQILGMLGGMGSVGKRFSGIKAKNFSDVETLVKSWSQNPNAFQGWLASASTEGNHESAASQVNPYSPLPLMETKVFNPAAIRREDCRRPTFFGPMAR